MLQQVATDDVIGVIVINEGLDQEEKKTDDNSSNVPDTQLTFVKQDDAIEVGKSFTPVDIAVSVPADSYALHNWLYCSDPTR